MARSPKNAPTEEVENTETQTETTGTETVETAAAEQPVKERKSIVPAGWKSKNDELKQFIDGQCKSKGDNPTFEFPAFFELCAKNGVPTDKIERYKTDMAEKKHGASGRTLMTLRNMLATVARKNGKLTALNGEEVVVNVAKQAVGGAAAKAQEAAAAKSEAASEPEQAATE